MAKIWECKIVNLISRYEWKHDELAKKTVGKETKLSPYLISCLGSRGPNFHLLLFARNPIQTGKKTEKIENRVFRVRTRSSSEDLGEVRNPLHFRLGGILLPSRIFFLLLPPIFIKSRTRFILSVISFCTVRFLSLSKARSTCRMQLRKTRFRCERSGQLRLGCG